MIFTKEEIKRLEELASWGIQKGIKDPDLKNAAYKLRRLMKADEDARIYLDDPLRGAGGRTYVVTNLVSLTEKYLNRPLQKEETVRLQNLIDQGLSYEDIKYGFDQCVSDLSKFDMQYVVELLVKEIGIQPDEISRKYMRW